MDNMSILIVLFKWHNKNIDKIDANVVSDFT